jgi:hypothetical protein
MRPIGAYILWTVLASAAVAIVFANRRRAAAWQPLALAGVAAGSVTAFALVSWGRATPLGDFIKAYYPAGLLITGDPSRLYACEAANLCFVNLPLVALLFTPLSVLGRWPAQILFTLAGAIAVVAAAWLTVRDLDAVGARRYAIVAVFALNGPLLYSARLGNLTHVLLPLLVIAFMSLTRGRDVRAGVLLAVLTVMKLPFLLFLPYLVVRGRRLAAAAFALSLALMVIVSVALFGAELHATWLQGFVGPFATRPVGAYNVQSVAALLAHLMMPGNLTNWMPLDPSPLFTALQYAILLGLTGTAALTLIRSGSPRRPAAHRTELHMVLTLTLLASPLTWTHYYAFLVVPLAAYAASRVDVPGPAWRAIAAAAAVLVSLPVVLPVAHHRLLGAVIERILISHYAWGGMLLLAALCASRATAPSGDGRAVDERRRLLSGRPSENRENNRWQLPAMRYQASAGLSWRTRSPTLIDPLKMDSTGMNPNRR